MMSNQSKWRRLATEANNPSTRVIDTLPLAKAVKLLIADHRSVFRAVERQAEAISGAAELVADAIQKAGRVVFVGAGTSGRLAVLEAAEMPPTFGIPSRSMIAVMAGGRSAVHRAREGVEDDQRAGAAAVERLGLTSKDVVVGISASGVTPFVGAALTRAAKAKARVIGVTCDPSSALRRMSDVTILLRVGPEPVAGSTRLTAGTATKMALNLITTAAMIRAGKTYGNLMVDVQSNSAKLRDRQERIVQAATGLSEQAAAELLVLAGRDVKAAIVMHATGLSRAQARRQLIRVGGSVRAAIAEAAPRRHGRRSRARQGAAEGRSPAPRS